MKTDTLSTEFFLSAANVADDGWIRVSAYGDFPNHAGMQRVDKSSGAVMAANFSSAVARLVGFLRGAHTLPAYLGHPDHPAFANSAGHEDTTRYAEVDGVEARDDGVYCHFKWSDAWNAVKDKAPKLYISPHWAMTEIAKGSKIFSPRKLLSIGLVPKANLPFASAVNTDEPEPATSDNSTMDKAKLLKLLGLATDATDEQINAALDAAITAAEKTVADKAAADTALADAKKETAAANAARDAALAATAAERKARAADVIDRAIANGKITAAERTAHEASLNGAADFVAAANAILNKETEVKTKATVTDVDKRNSAADAASEFEAAVNTRMKDTGESRNIAFIAVANTATGKALLEKQKTEAAAKS